MGSIAKFRKKQLGFLTAAVMATVAMPTAWAMPEGEHEVKNVVLDKETNKIPVKDGIMTVEIKPEETRGAIKWDSFSIGSDEQVHFTGPKNEAWMVLNMVTGTQPSEIYGTGLDGKGAITGDHNGTIFLVNRNGILFGENSLVDVGSLVASTLECDYYDFLGNKNNYVFNEKNNQGLKAVKNLGSIKTSDKGIVALIGNKVYNEDTGSIKSGQVILAAGKKVSLNNLVGKLDLDDEDKFSIAYDTKIDVIVEGSTGYDTGEVTTGSNGKQSNKWENLAGWGQLVPALKSAEDKLDGYKKDLEKNPTSEELKQKIANEEQNISVIKEKIEKIRNEVHNEGKIIAKNGYVFMQAQKAKDALNTIVNNRGVIEAATIGKDKDGAIVLEGVNVTNSGKISVTADGTAAIDINSSNLLLKGGIEGKNLYAEGKKDSSINTTAIENILVSKEATIQAPGGSWNITAPNIYIEEADLSNAELPLVLVESTETGDKSVKLIVDGDANNKNRVSNEAISNALTNTNVNVVAATSAVIRDSFNKKVKITDTPNKDGYYADVAVKEPIKKSGTADTSLHITADRNISVDADIKSTDGKLDVLLNSNMGRIKAAGAKITDKSKISSPGVVAIRADIETKGGDFKTNFDGEKSYDAYGTYFGLKDGEEKGTLRYIKTEGGEIYLGGREVRLATGGKVELNTQGAENKYGAVTIDGTVNSANGYSFSVDKSKSKSWAEFEADVADDKDAYLAVITDEMEDAVVSSTIPRDYSRPQQTYVGGHVVAVELNDDGTVKRDAKGVPIVKRDSNGNIELISVKRDAKGNIVQINEDKTNLKGSEKKAGGWYKAGVDEKGNPIYERYWAWVDGDGEEKGKIFYVQTTGRNIPDTGQDAPGHVIEDGIYTNFSPSDIKSDHYSALNNDTYVNEGGSQTALAVNFDKNDTAKMGLILQSKWDDVSDIGGYMHQAVIENRLGNSSLNIIAGDTTLNDAVGNNAQLDNVNILSTGNINAHGFVKVDNDMVAKARGSVTVDDLINAKAGKVELVAGSNYTKSADAYKVAGAVVAGHDVTTNGVTAKQTVTMVADNDVIINNAVKSEAKSNEAVLIVAQNAFKNDYGKNDAVSADNGFWKIYSNAPASDNFGSGVGNASGDADKDLNSKNFAGWGWGNKDGLTYIPDEGNRYIFKYNPTLTFTAKDARKRYGTEISNTGWNFKNELSGQFLNNFSDGNDELFQRDIFSKAAIGTDSQGYPKSANVGKYAINMMGTYGAAAGYIIKNNPGTLTVWDTPATPVTPATPATPSTTSTPSTPSSTVTPKQTVTPVPAAETEVVERVSPADKPQLDALTTSNLSGTASISEAQKAQGPSSERVLGLQSAELPFFNEKKGKVELYGTYDVSVDPDKVKMEPTAKVLPEPEQTKNQYRELEREITTSNGTAVFKLTYNGSTLDIYPTDKASAALLVAGDKKKNEEIESKALFEAFNHMGITLDDLDGIYTHFESMKVDSFRA